MEHSIHWNDIHGNSWKVQSILMAREQDSNGKDHQFLVGLFTDFFNGTIAQILMESVEGSQRSLHSRVHSDFHGAFTLKPTFRYRRKPSAIFSVHQSLSPPHVGHTTINLTLTGLLKIRRHY